MLIRESASLCLTYDSGWGGVSRGWARIVAAPTMPESGTVVKGELVHHPPRGLATCVALATLL